MTTKLMVPTIHMNGTSRGDLFDAYYNAIKAITAAADELAKCHPNGRDYYVVGPNAIFQAQNEHRSRIERLLSVNEELTEIAMEIQE